MFVRPHKKNRNGTPFVVCRVRGRTSPSRPRRTRVLNRCHAGRVPLYVPVALPFRIKLITRRRSNADVETRYLLCARGARGAPLARRFINRAPPTVRERREKKKNEEKKKGKKGNKFYNTPRTRDTVDERMGTTATHNIIFPSPRPVAARVFVQPARQHPRRAVLSCGP